MVRLPNHRIKLNCQVVLDPPISIGEYPVFQSPITHHSVFIISSLVIVAYFYLAIHSFSNILFIGVAAVILFAVLWLKIFSFMNKANTYQAKQVFNYAIFFTLGMDLLIIIKSFFS